MKFIRASGVLLHPTSFPSNHGIGDLGKYAYEFIDFLNLSKQKLWQVCPLGPTGYGNSPYQCFSAFAGNPLLISLHKLVDEGLLYDSDICGCPNFDSDKVQYENVEKYKTELLRKAYKNFRRKANIKQNNEYKVFFSKNYDWLENYALFMALKDAHDGDMWRKWKEDIAHKEVKAVEEWKKILDEDINYYKFVQYEFFKQWFELKAYANKKNIQIIGDVPIYVSYDSADVWANPHLFSLDKKGYPTKIAGVPPDYFSPTGQLWGNVLYNWKIHKNSGYKWWIRRIEMVLNMVDIIRVDHFRGFESYWAIPYGSDTAINGSWEKGPNEDIFNAIERSLGNLPIIAEDLGIITPEVDKLRNKFNYPGMKVLQFAFDSSSDNVHLPHMYTQNCVVYTGTHDNDTTLGWYQKLSKEVRSFANRYACNNNDDISWNFIRIAFASSAKIAIIPLQDILSLDSSARMNIPGTINGNWKWRYTEDMLKSKISSRLKDLSSLYNR